MPAGARAGGTDEPPDPCIALSCARVPIPAAFGCRGAVWLSMRSYPPPAVPINGFAKINVSFLSLFAGLPDERRLRPGYIGGRAHDPVVT